MNLCFLKKNQSFWGYDFSRFKLKLSRKVAQTLLILFKEFNLFFFKVYLTCYEYEERYLETRLKLNELRSFFNKYEKLSFPISYSLKFYENLSTMPTIYVITPTNSRAETQLADLTRLRNSLWLVPKLFWIVVEDSPFKTKRIIEFMNECEMPSVHLNEQSSDDLILKSSEKTWAKPRGVLQRNKGLEWLRQNALKIDPRGVVYFADDDNSYDLRLFEEMRNTKKASAWPVAFVGELMYERPVCKDGKVMIKQNFDLSRFSKFNQYV